MPCRKGVEERLVRDAEAEATRDHADDVTGLARAHVREELPQHLLLVLLAARAFGARDGEQALVDLPHAQALRRVGESHEADLRRAPLRPEQLLRGQAEVAVVMVDLRGLFQATGLGVQSGGARQDVQDELLRQAQFDAFPVGADLALQEPRGRLHVRGVQFLEHVDEDGRQLQAWSGPGGRSGRRGTRSPRRGRRGGLPKGVRPVVDAGARQEAACPDVAGRRRGFSRGARRAARSGSGRPGP